MTERRQIYAKFIGESDHNMFELLDGGAKSLGNIKPLLRLFGEISLISSDAVRDAARQVCDAALRANSAENETKEPDHYSVKKAFLDAARHEIATLEAETQGRPIWRRTLRIGRAKTSA
ncbi:hypothetical protein [Sphingobium sp. Leaf26]|uniref:hypothetical protein n=1 Tax=Sphingobium sp. Leaf26 TaxID=1735693 RepID=UPI0012E21D38|nr:hypothetical protein [Sphingobium sp. Leaf26]